MFTMLIGAIVSIGLFLAGVFLLVESYFFSAGSSFLPGCVMILVGSFFGVNLIRHSRRMKLYKSHNYAWYAKQHPGLVKNGRVRCHNCSGGRIQLRNLKEHTYTRAHICSDCGTTLYYSPEQ